LNILDTDDCVLAQSQHPSKILVRTYNDDGSTKSILVDDSMLVRDVLFLLIHKNHREPDVNYAIVEILPDLHMGMTIPSVNDFRRKEKKSLIFQNVFSKIIKN